MSIIGECVLAFVFGTAVGLLVQRSRFCNTAALRDAMLFKTYRNTKALLVAMMILTLGFTGFITIGEGNPMRFDVGINQIIGLFLFGIGMVLAGACTVSTWVKAGEGNIGAVWALIYTFAGMFLFSLVWSFIYWPPAPAAMSRRTGTGSSATGLFECSHVAGEDWNTGDRFRIGAVCRVVRDLPIHSTQGTSRCRKDGRGRIIVILGLSPDSGSPRCDVHGLPSEQFCAKRRRIPRLVDSGYAGSRTVRVKGRYR